MLSMTLTSTTTYTNLLSTRNDAINGVLWPISWTIKAKIYILDHRSISRSQAEDARTGADRVDDSSAHPGTEFNWRTTPSCIWTIVCQHINRKLKKGTFGEAAVKCFVHPKTVSRILQQPLSLLSYRTDLLYSPLTGNMISTVRTHFWVFLPLFSKVRTIIWFQSDL